MKRTKQNGITLIALVITIIVLLILAGVSIATLTGENGILTRATDSKEQTEIAEEKEAIQLAYTGVVAEKRGTGDVTAIDLNKEFETNGTNATAVDNGDGTITITFDPPPNRVYTVDKNGNIIQAGTGEVTPPSEEPGNPDDNGIFQEPSTIDGGVASSNNPTIPEGFRPMDTDTSSWGDGTSAPSAEDLGNGLVITDAPEGEVGNEFVWIPVANISEIANATSGTDTNGNQNYQGKLYDFTSTGATEKTNYGQGTESYREPDIVSDYDNNSDIIKGILTDNADDYADMNTFKTTMQEDYNEMIKSVEKYGGFYIGRYEISKSSSNTAQSKKNSTALTASTSSANMWYGLYAYGKTYTNTANSVVSSMVWGSQYDAMMRWMQSNGEDVTITTVPNGGNKNTSNTITGPEGDTDIIRNVYDLYGGRREWTLEANYTDVRDPRGGNYVTYIPNNSPSNRGNCSPQSALGDYSSRLALYVKQH